MLSNRAKAQAVAQNLTQRNGARTASESAHGTASFAAPNELAVLRSGPLLTGRFDGLLRYDGNGHLITFAPTGAGKSVSVVVPNLLTYPGSVVCIDPKGAIAPITAARRRAMGQKVVLLDPFKEVEKATEARGQSHLWPALSPAKFNPFGHLRRDAPDDAVDEVRLLASGLIVQENEKNRYFSDSARMVLEGFILHLLAENGVVTFGDLFPLAFDEPENLAKTWLRDMRKSTAFDGHVSHLAGQIKSLTGDAGANVWSTLHRSLNLIKSPNLLPTMQPSDVVFSEMKTTPTTLYLVLPARHLHTHGVWLRLMLSILIGQLSDARASRWPVLFLVDECAALGRLEILETAVGLMRGYGLKLWLIFQDLAQLKSVYSGRWESFISNSGVKQFFNVNDLETADFVSKYLGQETRWIQSESLASNSQLPGSNISAAGRPLLTADEVRRLERNQQILFYEGQKPVLADKLSYFDDGDFRDAKTGAKLFAPDPYVSAGETI